VFKENVRLSEALSCHMKEVDDLRKMTVSLAEENTSLALHKVHWYHGMSNRAVGIFMYWQRLDKTNKLYLFMWQISCGHTVF
jgi:regulator of replication initiation timing